MTAQISDGFHYQGYDFTLAGISEGDLFDPALLKLEPVGFCSACWRGYYAVFGLADGQLVLDELHVRLTNPVREPQPRVGPAINGVQPTGPRNPKEVFDNHYVGLAYPLEYSGGLLLADGFIQELYVHMGFHPAWKYEMVVELVFEQGVLKEELDRSEKMAEIRKLMRESQLADAPSRFPSLEEIGKFVERAFDRRYRRSL